MGRHVDDITGMVIAGVKITGRGPNSGAATQWYFACKCGGRRLIRRDVITEMAKHGKTATCHDCADARRGGRGPRKSGTNIPGPAPREGKDCRLCAGLPWRRPEDGSPCLCERFYAPEKVAAVAPMQSCRRELI